MLATSSPIVFPPSSSPQARKRDTPHDHDRPNSNPRRNGPFVDDGDESEEDGGENAAPPAKKRMLERQPDAATAALVQDPLADEGPSLVDFQGGRDGGDETEKPDAPQAPHSGSLPMLWSGQRPLFSGSFLSSATSTSYTMRTCSGKASSVRERNQSTATSYESIVAARSKTKEGRAKRSYYGIEIHELVNAASKERSKQQPPASEPEAPRESKEPASTSGSKPKKSLLWTEKYRARNFMDLCGDDGTNRLVLRWLKKWDPVVFPGAAKSKAALVRRPGMKQEAEEEKPHRKILMLTGPPGLGKTTLAHVCAKQAGYEVIEVNASDDRSRDVVKNRIRTSLGTESVKNITNRKSTDDGRPQKVAKPACVIVDEVDGAVTGSGASGEGGFVRALIDLVLLDQKNSSSAHEGDSGRKRKKKEDDFRLMRPLILICNDVYHPSLRPLRQSNLAEIVHVGRPTLEAVVSRLKSVFEKEGIPCEKDAARKLCEAAWGMTSGIDAKRGAESTVEGDLRGVMVVGEWVAGRFRSSSGAANLHLTRQWIERHILHDLASGAGGARGLGRGSVKDIVSRLFQEGGGFPKQAMDLSESKNRHEQPKTELGFGEQQKKYAMERLGQMIETSGDISHIMTEVFTEYPNRDFNDDCYLTKPNTAYDWLHFHDACQSRLYASQDWELAPYLSQPVLACHHLFASPKRHFVQDHAAASRRPGFDGAAQDDEAPPLPFSGPRADFQAHEAEKQNRAQLLAMQSQLGPSLMRSIRSAEDVATDFLPYIVRMLSPDVKPVVVGGSQGSMASVRRESERAMVKRAAEVLADVGIVLQKGKIETEDMASRTPQFVYRMDPDLDALSTFETAASLVSSQAPVRYAVRQVLDQELQRTIAHREALARQARFQAGGLSQLGVSALPTPRFDDKDNAKRVAGDAKTAVKRDFFGRIVEARPLAEVDGNSQDRRPREEAGKVWVTYHEGLNNAVRRPISLQEFLKGL